MKSSEAMIGTVMKASLAIAWRSLIQDFTMPVRNSNQLSYKATNGETWSFVGSNVPVMNEWMNEWMNECMHEWTKWYMNIWSYDHKLNGRY